MRSAGITFISLALTSAVIGNAYYQKKQFYPSVVYITKSNPSMAVIYVQALILVVLMGKLMRKIFFGQLRAAEFEHLMERSWYAVTETCLAFTVFRDDFSPKFVALFTVLLFIKSFHWLAEERVDFMERSPVISFLFHFRVLCLLTLLGSLDLNFVGLAYQSTVTKGASVQLVFGFEYAILLTIIINIFIKYVLHTLDLNSENPWDNKAVFLLYTELVMGFFKVVLYIAFVAIMVRIYTLPLFAFRPMYYTMRSFKKAFNDVILSRRAIRNMNTLYPDATPEELAAADNVCIICREEMLTASKKLPCNHIFHTSCLRSWFQRQQTCPTCRLNILRTPSAPNAPAPPPQRAAPGVRPAEPQAQPNMFQAGVPNQLPAGFVPFWQPFQQPGANPNPAPEPAAAADAGPNAFQPPNPNATDSQFQQQQNAYPNFQMFNPPFPFMPPFTMPPPVPPPNLAVLTDEELRRMEGQAREAVESRIRCLENIQLLLDASVALMQQYSLVAGTPNQGAMGHGTGQAAPTEGASTAQPGASTASQGAAGQSSVTTSSSAPVEVAATVTEAVHIPSRSEAVKSSASVPTISLSPTSTPSSTSTSVEAQEESLAAVASAPVLTKEQEEIRRRRLEKFGAHAVPNAE